MIVEPQENRIMRFKLLIASGLLLVMSGPLFAQDDYTEFSSKEDRLTVTFPGKPTISEGIWTTEYGVVLPSKIYTIAGISGRHTLTVVDYTPVERILEEKSRHCGAGEETCSGVGDTGLGYWKNDIRGAVTYAISKMLTERDVKVTHLMFNFMEMVGGQEIQLTNLKDQSRTFASAYMHANRLIIAESTVPKGFPPPTIMQQSLGWLDETGTRGIRYQYLYLNEPDHAVVPPPLRGQAVQQNGARPDRIDPGAAGAR
jgi:hypothetical protein